jgi:hypothetical protein
MRPQHGQKLEEPGVQDVSPTKERSFQARHHEVEFDAVFLEKPAEARHITRRKTGYFLFHPPDVSGGIQFAALAKNDAVLRIKPHELELIGDRRPGGGENSFEDAGIKKERGTKIKTETVGLDGGSPAAKDGETLKELHLGPAGGKKNGSGQAAGAGADNDNGVFHQREVV